MEPRLIRTNEAARLLGVERRTLLRMEQAGTLVPFRAHPKAQRLYRSTDIERLLGTAS